MSDRGNRYCEQVLSDAQRRPRNQSDNVATIHLALGKITRTSLLRKFLNYLRIDEPGNAARSRLNEETVANEATGFEFF